MTIRTGLLEARYLWGDQELFDELRQRFDAEVVTGNGRDFVEAKLAERDERHQRMGNSPLPLEPNIKEGKGGLRDLHTLFWIAKYLYRWRRPAELVDRGVLTHEEVAPFERAAALPVDRALPSALSHRPRRGAPDLRSAARARRGASAITDHAGQPRRRTLHEALFPGRQDGRRPDPHLLRGPRGSPAAQAAACGCAGSRLRRRELEGFRLEGERLTIAEPDDFVKDPAAMPAPVPCRAAAAISTSIPRALRLVTQTSEAGRCAAQRSRGQPPVPRDADLAARSRRQPCGG